MYSVDWMRPQRQCIDKENGRAKSESNCCNYVGQQLDLYAHKATPFGSHAAYVACEMQAGRQAVRQIDMQLLQLCQGTRTSILARTRADPTRAEQSAKSREAKPCRAELMLSLSASCFFCLSPQRALHISCLLCPSITCTFAYYNLHKFPSWSCGRRVCQGWGGQAAEWVWQG